MNPTLILVLALICGASSEAGEQKKSHFAGRGVDIARVDGQSVNSAQPAKKNLKSDSSGATDDRYNGKYQVTGSAHRYKKRKSVNQLARPASTPTSSLGTNEKTGGVSH